MCKEKIIKKGRFVKREVLVVGIDIGSQSHIATGVSLESDFTKPIIVRNNRGSYERFIETIEGWKVKLGCKDVVVGFESTGHYWKPLGYYLKSRGISLVEVSTISTKKSREMMDNSPLKADKKDARIIADLVRQGKVLTAILPEGKILELRNFMHTRENFIKERKGIENKIHKIIDITFPERMSVIKSVENKTSIYLLRKAPFPDNIIKRGLKWLKREMRKRSRGRYNDLDAERLYSLAKDTIGLKIGLEGLHYELKSLLKRLEVLKEEIKDIEKHIEEIARDMEEYRYIKSIKGVGMITTAAIISESGGIKNYGNAKELEKLAGINLYEVSSGKHKGERRITKMGRALMRQKLYLAAIQQARENMPLNNFYKRLINRGIKRPKALIAVSRKLLTIIFALVRDGREYEEGYVKEAA